MAWGRGYTHTHTHTQSEYCNYPCAHLQSVNNNLSHPVCPVILTYSGYHLDDTQCRCGAQYPVSSDPEIRDCCDLCTELKSMLKVQANVNKELKRLLVASVGSDFQHHLEQTVHEKAELSCELDAALQQSITSREDMDRISIDCDIWRSKFLASRLMIDELASWKAELSLKYEESQHALQCMLQERKQLSQVLLLAKTNLSKAIELHSTSFSGNNTFPALPM